MDRCFLCGVASGPCGERHAHDVLVLVLASDVELPHADLVEAEAFVEADGRGVVRVNPEQQAARSRSGGVSDRGRYQPLAQASALELAEQIDALELQVAGRIRQR